MTIAVPKLFLKLNYPTSKSIFVDNGFPLKVIENVLNRKSQQWESEGNVDTVDENANNKPEVDYSKAYYAPYHPKAAKMFRTLKKKFNIDCVYKKQLHWEIISSNAGLNKIFGTLLMYATKYLVANAQ